MFTDWYSEGVNVEEAKIGKKAMSMLMRACKAASYNSDYDRTKFGCVIFYKSRILATGWNMKKSNPLQLRYNRLKANCSKLKNSTHAEIDAILNFARKQLGREERYSRSDLSIFIYRENSAGKLAIARPCVSCYQAIKDFGIKDIYYTGDGSIIHEIIL